MNVVLGNQSPLSISRAMTLPEKCLGGFCVGRLRRSMTSGVCVLRCEDKSHHMVFPIMIGDGKIDYMFTTRGLQHVKRDGKHVIYEWQALGRKSC